MNRPKRVFYLLLLISLVPGLFNILGCSNPTANSTAGEKAAIIDQLHARHPNQGFIDQATQYLEDYGFHVDVYSDVDVTVDLLRSLPTYGYKLIIFRTHSGLLGVDPKVTNRTWLFTSEPYSKFRYLTEQLTDQLTYARISDDSPWVFAVSAKFFAESTEKPFDKTAIIMMGCDCLHFDDLAQAFIQRGASTYLAWNVSVGINYVDDAVTALIEKLCSQELTIAEAVVETMKQEGADPKHGARLNYYPPRSGNKTLQQLIK